MKYSRYLSLLGAALLLASCTQPPGNSLTLTPNAIVIPDDQVDSATAQGMNVQVENVPTAGQVVISDEGEGLVRRITGVQQTGVGEVNGQIVRKVFLQTEEAALEDAIASGEANISMDNLPIGEDNLTQSLDGVSVQNFTGRINLTNVTFNIPGVPNGRITLNGAIEQNLKPNFNLKFSNGSVETFQAGINGTLKATVRTSISASAGYSPFNLSRDLATWNIKRVFTVGAVPVVVVLQPRLVAAVSSGANGQVTVEVGIAPTFTTNMQLDYSRARPTNARWQNTFKASFGLNPTFSYAAPVQGSGNAATGLVMDVKFYGLLGPTLEARPFVNLALNGNNGSAALKSGIQGNSKVEAGFKVLGKGLETSYAGPSVEEAKNFTCTAAADACTAN